MSQPPRILQGIAGAMRHLSDRQRVLAQNIANADTPGYKSKEVEAPDFGRLVGGAIERPKVRLTSGMAGLGARAPSAGSGVVYDRHVSETKPDGNNVTLEDQLLKIGEVQADYATLTTLYRKQIGLLKTAVGKGGQ